MRNLDDTSRFIRFAGYDGLKLIGFSISTATLAELAQKHAVSETDGLKIFDTLRVKIQNTAMRTYKKGGKSQNTLVTEMF